MEKIINLNSENIKIKGHIGTWYVIDESYYQGKKVFLLEHEIYGDETAGLIVNENAEIIVNECWNGFEDLEDL